MRCRRRSQRLCPTLFVAALVSTCSAPGSLFAEEVSSTGKTAFAVKVNGERVAYHTFGIYVLPGKRVSMEFPAEGGERGFDVVLPSLTSTGARRPSWIAPQEPGIYPIDIRWRGSGETMRLNIFVLVPFRPGQDETLEGYRIGRLPPSFPQVDFEDGVASGRPAEAEKGNCISSRQWSCGVFRIESLLGNRVLFALGCLVRRLQTISVTRMVSGGEGGNRGARPGKSNAGQVVSNRGARSTETAFTCEQG